MFKVSVICLLLLVSGSANSLDLSAISNTDATTALRTALTQGAGKAVESLARTDGFFGNPQVKIPLPQQLQKAEQLMRKMGLGSMADELVLTMNRAAEAAVPEAKTLLVGAVISMTLTDARALLSGGPDSATQYFRNKTQSQLTLRFKPIVMKVTAKLGVVKSYNSLAAKAAQFGLLDSKTANIDDYVTAQTLDGLYKMIATEEQAIRSDPVGQFPKQDSTRMSFQANRLPVELAALVFDELTMLLPTSGNGMGDLHVHRQVIEWLRHEIHLRNWNRTLVGSDFLVLALQDCRSANLFRTREHFHFHQVIRTNLKGEAKILGRRCQGAQHPQEKRDNQSPHQL